MKCPTGSGQEDGLGHLLLCDPASILRNPFFCTLRKIFVTWQDETAWFGAFMKDALMQKIWGVQFDASCHLLGNCVFGHPGLGEGLGCIAMRILGAQTAGKHCQWLLPEPDLLCFTRSFARQAVANLVIEYKNNTTLAINHTVLDATRIP